MNNKYDLSQIITPLLQWYRQSARELPWRSDPQPYRVWVSEIMLQQTRVEAVKPYFEQFMLELPNVEALAEADEEKLLKLWQGLGYYSRVRNLQKAAQIIMNEHDGKIPSSYELLRNLPGIGEYTAGAIASIAFGLPVPAVDGNVLRVLSRLTKSYADIMQTKVKREFGEQLKEIYPKSQAGDFTQALMELGAMVCLPNGAPLCEQCPLSTFCLAHQHKVEKELPIKTIQKARKKEKRTIILLLCENNVALNKRGDSGLLAGLWEFINLESHYSLDEVKHYLKTLGIDCSGIKKLKKAKHIFSHVEWNMKGYLVTTDNKSSNFVWVNQNQLEEQFAVPNAFKTYQDILKEQWDKTK